MNNNKSAQREPIPPADADMVLLFLGSWFEKLLHAPEGHQATLDALAGHIILDERPKTLLGLVITALAEKWLGFGGVASVHEGLGETDARGTGANMIGAKHNDAHGERAVGVGAGFLVSPRAVERACVIPECCRQFAAGWREESPS